MSRSNPQHGPHSGCIYPGCDPHVRETANEHGHLQGWLIDVVCFAYRAGRISEGQAARLIGTDRMSFRVIRDEWEEWNTVQGVSAESVTVDEASNEEAYRQMCETGTRTYVVDAAPEPRDGFGRWKRDNGW